jgi:exodeoxyribonuclease VII small subunit
VASTKPLRKKSEPSAETPSTFEDSIRRLGEIVESLEAGELPIEDSLRLFEEGVRLARAAQSRLDHAERRVEELLAVSDDGEPTLQEVDVK